MQYKDGKIIIIIEEFSVSGNTYNLNGIDLDHAVFFVREDRKKFRALLPAEYKINTTGANTDLVIEDGILNYCIAVQVGFDISKISDEYNPTGNPDIVILKDQYNQLVKDFKNLWKYVEKQGLSSDALNQDTVIPVLKNGETFVMQNGSLEATPLVVAEEELQNLLDELIKKSQDILDDYVFLLTENSKTEINSLVNNSKNEINTLTEDTKTEILQFFEDNKGNFLNRTEIREEINYLSGAEYKENNIFGTELKNIIKDQMYYYGNIPYMAKVTATSSTGFLAPDTTKFQDIRNNTLYEQFYKNIIEFDKVIYNPGDGSSFWKFFRYGKRATFFISYTLSGEVWLEHTKVANFPIGFIPDTEFLYSEHKIYIKTNSHTGEERALLAKDGVEIVGVAGKLIYEIKGVVNYLVK